MLSVLLPFGVCEWVAYRLVKCLGLLRQLPLPLSPDLWLGVTRSGSPSHHLWAGVLCRLSVSQQIPSLASELRPGMTFAKGPSEENPAASVVCLQESLSLTVLSPAFFPPAGIPSPLQSDSLSLLSVSDFPLHPPSILCWIPLLWGLFLSGSCFPCPLPHFTVNC